MIHCLHIRNSILQSIEQDALELSTLIEYVSYARKHIQPQLSDEAAEELTRGYVELRRRGNFPGSSKKVRNIHVLCTKNCAFTYTSPDSFLTPHKLAKYFAYF